MSLKVQEWAFERILNTVDRDGSILEVGCGRGSFTRALAATGMNLRCADLILKHEPIAGIEHTSGADLSAKLPFDEGSFRTVIALEVIEHITNPFRAVEEMARVLEPGGRLYLTFPNYWGARQRVRFLIRGSVNRSHVHDTRAQENLREGRCAPHINTMPWPTLKYALVSYGLEVEDLRGHQRKPQRQLALFPLAALLWLIARLSPRRQRLRWELDETNRWSVLFSSRHVLVQARKATRRAS
jgi:SAM-dependent methyltransferase